MKKTIEDIDVKGKKALIRCDFNVPLSEDGSITDDSRITATLPTLKFLLERGAALILMSHLGRPDGEANMKYSLRVVAERLSMLLGKSVTFVSSPTVVDDDVKTTAKNLQPGDIMLLENVRFRKEETKNGPDFAKELASLGDLFVNDAFGTAHRAHASTTRIATYLPAVSGYLLEKEIEFLGEVVENPERPFVAIMGGAKVSDKVPVIENLLKKVDTLIIGGGMAFTFLKSQGFEIGSSILEKEHLELASSLLSQAESAGIKLLLPVDVVMAREFRNDAEQLVCSAQEIPAGWMGFDIGPKTIDLFCTEIKNAKTILWNGPMGVFEMPNFAKGTKAVAEALAESGAVTLIGGGDSAAAIEQLNLTSKITHVSTGGGASLEYLGGKVLPGVAALLDR